MSLSRLIDVRQAVFRQADWQPSQSTEAVARCNEYINRAMIEIALEAPFLFSEITSFATQTDHVPTVATDTISTDAADAWVFVRDVAAGGAVIAWDEILWAGRMLEYTQTDGTVRRTRIREIFTTGQPARQKISVMEPWTGVADTSMPYRIYTDTYYVSDRVVKINSARMFASDQSWPLDVIGEEEAEDLSLTDRPVDLGQGIPRSMFRRPFRALPSPIRGPTAALDQQGSWAGPEKAGQFEYCYTWGFGRRDPEFGHISPETQTTALTVADRFEPLWESAASPVVSATTTNGAATIDLTFPELEFLQAFSGAGERFERSGWKIRIYRRRVTQDGVLAGTPAGSPALHELSSSFNFLDELDPSDAGYPVYTDSGAVTPDYFRRLRDTTGYQAITLYPRPDARYVIDIRAHMEPLELENDYDTIPLDGTASNLLVYKALEFLYESEGNINMSAKSQERYLRTLRSVSKRYGDLRHDARPTYRRYSRAYPGSGRRQGNRKWWSTSS